MSYGPMSISLKRIDKKTWQYGNCPPTRVELAVLDFLKLEGWRGYFTQHFDFDHTLAVMMCFCNHNWYINNEATHRDFRMPTGVTADLPVRTINDVFLLAADGYFDFDNHHWTRDELVENARRFQEDDIRRVLTVWKKRGMRSFIVGAAYNSPRDAHELDENDLVSYFRARGGLDYFLDLIEFRFSARRQELMYRVRQLSAQFLESDDAAWDLEREVRSQINDAGYFLNVFSSAKKMPTVDEWINVIASNSNTALASEALKLAEDIGRYWTENKAQGELRKVDAVLDLVIWKDAIACVEVKAPNDKLKPHQIAQLARDKEDGKVSWVVNVNEL